MLNREREIEQKEVLEKGDIYFFYRPKVQPKADEVHQPHTLADIQRFYIILHPENKPSYRLCVLGRKHMPDVQAHEKFWVTVEKVTNKQDELNDYLEAETYQTKTRGERLLPQARLCGTGRYSIIYADKQTYLSYRLIQPQQKMDLQKQFNLPEQANYVLSIKNQAIAGTLGGERAKFPGHLQNKLGSLRFAPLKTPDFLDYPNAELVLIGANISLPSDMMKEVIPAGEEDRVQCSGSKVSS